MINVQDNTQRGGRHAPRARFRPAHLRGARRGDPAGRRPSPRHECCRRVGRPRGALTCGVTAAFEPGFWLVFFREIGRLRRRPFLLALTTIVPLLLIALLTAVFSAGLATRLPVAVLDLDGSELSRTVIRTVDATPDTAVAMRVGRSRRGPRADPCGQGAWAPDAAPQPRARRVRRPPALRWCSSTTPKP